MSQNEVSKTCSLRRWFADSQLLLVHWCWPSHCSVHLCLLFVIIFGSTRSCRYWTASMLLWRTYCIRSVILFVIVSSSPASETPLQPNIFVSTDSRTEVGTPIDVKWCRTLSLQCNIQYRCLELGKASLLAVTSACSSSDPVTMPSHTNSLDATVVPLRAALTDEKKCKYVGNFPSPCSMIGPTKIGGSWVDLRTTFLFLNTIRVTYRELRLKVLSTDRTERKLDVQSCAHSDRRSSICSCVNRTTAGGCCSCMQTERTKSSDGSLKRDMRLCISSARLQLLFGPSARTLAAVFCTYI